MLHMANRQLEIITGCMFSGKTDELIRRLERVRIAGRSILLFKPTIDDRYAAAAVVTHYGREFAASAAPWRRNPGSVDRSCRGRCACRSGCHCVR